MYFFDNKHSYATTAGSVGARFRKYTDNNSELLDNHL